VECAHIKLKYRNCGGKYRANSNQCSIWGRQAFKVSNLNSNELDVQMKNTPDFEVVISNNGVWE